MSDTKLSTSCPGCGKALSIDLPNFNPLDFAPDVRSLIKPVGSIFVYRINSEEIKQFIIQKAKKYVNEARVEVVTRYCEKKNSNPHRGYASLRIAFSDNVLEKSGGMGWYEKLGENDMNVRFEKSIFKNLIEMYRYSKKDIEGWLSSYKDLEKIENKLGITEAFIEDIRMYSTPQRVPAQNEESWIIFSAAAENVLKDMLTEQKVDAIPGTMEIQDVYPISKDVVEFIIYLHPLEVKMKENPYVRQIMLGDNKKK